MKRFMYFFLAFTLYATCLRADEDRWQRFIPVDPTGNYTGATSTTSGAGGLATVSRIVTSSASTNSTVAKAGAGRVYKITGYNVSASIRWLHLYNTASTPTPGTTPVYFSLPLPPGAYSFDAINIGYFFSTGVSYSITAGPADNDNTAIAAGDILNQNVWVQ